MKVFFALALLAVSFHVYPSKELYREMRPAVVKIEILNHGEVSSTGTGFFYGPDGYIVSNAHVVNYKLKSKDLIRITDSDGNEINDATFINCKLEDIDLCLIKTKVKPKSYFKKNSKGVEQGEKIYVIGHSLGLDYSISDGLVSGKRKFKTIDKKAKNNTELYQISAPISPGNSGGPAFDSKGNLIGVSTFTYGLKLKGQNINFTITNKELLSFYNKSIKQKFYAFENLKKFNANIEKSVYDKKIRTLGQFLSVLSMQENKLKKKDFAYRLKSKYSNLVLDLYMPKGFLKCKSIMTGVNCSDGDKVKSMLYTITSERMFKEGLEYFFKREGKLNKLYQEIIKTEAYKKDKSKIDKNLNLFKGKYLGKQCKKFKRLFNNHSKPLELCRHEFINYDRPGQLIQVNFVKLDSGDYVTIATEADGSDAVRLANHYVLLTFGLTNISKSPNKVSKRKKLKVSNAKKSTFIEGTIKKIYYSRTDLKLKVYIEAESGGEYRFRLPVNPESYNYPQLNVDDFIKITFVDTEKNLERGLRFKNFKPIKASIENKNQHPNELKKYQVYSIKLYDDYAFVRLDSDYGRVSARFYSLAMKQLSDKGISKGDILTLPPAHYVQSNYMYYIDGREFQVEKSSKMVSSSKKSNRIKHRGSTKSSRKSNTSIDNSFQGKVRSVRFSMTDSRQTLTTILNVNGEEIEFILTSDQSNQKFHNLVPLSQGDELSIKINMKQSSFDRWRSKGKFIVNDDRDSFDLRKLDSVNSLPNSLEGEITYIKRFSSYWSISLKGSDQRYKIKIFAKNADKLIKDLNLKKKDRVKLNAPDIESDRDDFIYIKDVRISKK